MIEIECGEYDKPVYVRGPLDSETRAKQIIAQLAREAGPGNYEVVWQTEEDFMEDGSWNNDTPWMDDDVDDIEEKYEDLSIAEKVDLIAEKFIQIKELSDVQSEEMAYLANSVINSYLDFDLLNSLSAELSAKLLEYEITEEYTDEMLGIEPNSDINREKWKDQFSDLYNLAINKPKSAGKKIKKLQKKMPENPALAFLDILVMQAQESPQYEEKLQSYHEQFPNYPLINIFWSTHEWLKNENANPVDFFKKGPENFFNGKESLHYIEMFHYLFLQIVTASALGNITLVEVVDMILDEIEMPKEDNVILSEMIAMTKMNFIISLKEEK